MADQNTVQVVIGANTEGIRRGSQEAQGAVDDILAKLKEFKGEAVQTGREARFFANELASIIPGAGGAAGALKELLAVGLSGSAIGAASEAVKLLVGVFHELKEKENAAREQVQKYVDEADKSLEAVKTKVDALLLSWKNLTAAQTIAATDLQIAKDREKDADAEALKAQLALGSARTEAMKAAASSQMKGAEAEKFISALTKEAADNYTNALTKLTKAKDVVLGIQEEIKKAAAGESARDAVKDEEAFRKRTLEEELADIAKFNADKKKQDFDAAQAAGEILQRRLELQDKAEADAVVALNKHEEDRLQQRIQIDKRLQDQDLKEAERRKKIAIDFAKPIEAAFTASIRSMIRGTADFSTAMREMLLGLVDAVIEGFVKMAGQAIIAAITGKAAAKLAAVGENEGNIAVAVSGAAASQAMIPFVGPELAAAAAAQMDALLHSMTAPLLSAARGADLPSGGPFPAILHSREMVLPEELADKVRAGGGDGELHVHIHGAVDGDSVRRVVNSDAFVRAIRDARRRGRLG